MHPATVALFKDKRCKDFMSGLSAKELQAFDESIHDASAEKTDEIETDILVELGLEIRRALTGRYRIFRKMTDDEEYWFFHNEDFEEFSRSLEHEPAIVVAALAIRPFEKWDWKLVEEWSWVYRHAELLDIDINDFAEWCADQDPESSRDFVTTETKRLGAAALQSNASALTPPIAASGNA